MRVWLMTGAAVSYVFTNRTPHMKLNRTAFHWLQQQIDKLSNLSLTADELAFLQRECPFLDEPYLNFLQRFRLNPQEHVKTTFIPQSDTGEEYLGELEIIVEGLWIDTILYEIPLLALISEAYFKFMDRDWTYEGQTEKAQEKGCRLIEGGCVVAEYGTRRRRDFRTLDLVIQGLTQANRKTEGMGYAGQIAGTSNVYMAMKYGITPVGTIAHEWFMGVAAVTDSYMSATETALAYWIGTFGKGVLGVALTDTFGTEFFLKAFERPVPAFAATGRGASTTLASSAIGPGQDSVNQLRSTESPIKMKASGETLVDGESYAEVFTGVRQDSGDPREFVKVMKQFYDTHPPKSKKSITFSDSLNVDKCIQYRKVAEEAGFIARFGVGTFFTSTCRVDLYEDICFVLTACTDDFARVSDGQKSTPLNIVIKLSSAGGKPAIKISDNLGKNTGDAATVANVKKELGYTERDWSEGDESRRWT